MGTIILDTYRIEGVLGRGGFGITYRATDLRLRMQVAIKEYFHCDSCLRPTGSAVIPCPGSERIFDWGRRSFLAEARLLAMFDHPGIVRVFNVLEANNTAYFVMKLEPGRPLKSWLASLGRRLRQSELDCLVASLLDALEAMHAKGCIHRDLSCDNIMIRPDGSPVLLDFGSARQLLAEQTQQLTGLVKTGYSPPEQYVSKGDRQGPWTDIYALGAVFYFAVTGRMPTPSPARMIEDDFVPAAEIAVGEFRQAFLTAIDRALELRPEARPQTVPMWRSEVFCVDEPAARLADTIITVTPQPPVVLQSSRHETKTEPVRPYRGAFLAAAAVTIAIPAAMTFVQLSESTPPPPVAPPAPTSVTLTEKAPTIDNLRRFHQARTRLLSARDWWQAQRRPSLPAMQGYVASHPKGHQAQTARRMLAAFRQCTPESPPGHAIPACKTLIGRYPELAEHYNILGRALGLTGNTTGAIARHNQALERAPELASVHAWRGQWYHALGQNALAAADFNLAVRSDAKSADDLLARGMAQLAISRFDPAIRDLDAAIAQMPASWIAYLSRARAHDQKNAHCSALADYRRVIALHSSHAFALAAVRRLEQVPGCKAGS